MKKIISATLLLFLFSCGNTEETSKEVETINETKTEACTFEYNGSSVVNWTGFKLSEKVGVNGTFDSVVVTKTNLSESVEEMMTGAEFQIQTSTVNSNDSLRDWKLANNFFAVMNETESISGSIISLENGSGEVSLTLNGVTIKTPVIYSVKDDSEVMLEATLNVPDWEAQSALDSLSEVCAEKHTGPDGVNKLWPDVKVKVFVGFNKVCK